MRIDTATHEGKACGEFVVSFDYDKAKALVRSICSVVQVSDTGDDSDADVDAVGAEQSRAHHVTSHHITSISRGSSSSSQALASRLRPPSSSAIGAGNIIRRINKRDSWRELEKKR